MGAVWSVVTGVQEVAAGLAVATLVGLGIARVVLDVRGYQAEDQDDALSLSQVRARFEPDPVDDPTRPAPSPASPGDEDPIDEPLPAAVVGALRLELPSLGGFGSHGGQREVRTRRPDPLRDPINEVTAEHTWTINTGQLPLYWAAANEQRRADSDTGGHRTVSVA